MSTPTLQSCERFTAWLETVGVKLRTDLLTIRPSNNEPSLSSSSSSSSRDPVAVYSCSSAPITVGTDIATIPKRSVLSVKNSTIGKLIIDAGITGGAALALAVAAENAMGERSKWAGYFAGVPDREDLPVTWHSAVREKEGREDPDGRSEDIALLEGTPLEMTAEQDAMMLIADFDEIVEPFVADHVKEIAKATEIEEGKVQEVLGFKAFVNATTLTASRAFYVDSSHGEAMVPFACMFNHRSGAEHVHIEGDSDDEDEDTACGEDKGDDDDDAGKKDDCCTDKSKGGCSDKKKDGCCGSNSGCSKDGKHAIKNKRENDDSIHENSNDEGGEGDCDDENCEGCIARREEHAGELAVSVVKEIPPGEEIFNTFGALSNAKLLHRYGFVEMDNPNDTLEIPGSWVLSVFEDADREKLCEPFLRRAAAEKAAMEAEKATAGSDSDCDDDSDEDEESEEPNMEEIGFEVGRHGDIDTTLMEICAAANPEGDKDGNKALLRLLTATLELCDSEEKLKESLAAVLEKRPGLRPESGGGYLGAAAAVVLKLTERLIIEEAISAVKKRKRSD